MSVEDRVCELTIFSSKPAGEIHALNCAKRGYDIATERPQLREIVDVIKERTNRIKHPLLTENMVAGYGGK